MVCFGHNMQVKKLFQDAEVATDLLKGGDALVDVTVFVGCRELDADAGLVFRDDGVAESGDVDSLLLHPSGELLGECRVVEHHGTDGTLGRLDVEAEGGHLGAEVLDVVH